MNNNYIPDFLTRSLPILTEAGIKKLQKVTVGVAGCGGVGGTYAVTLARLGVRSFLLADPGVFDPPDINRQWAASTETLGQNKAVVYETILKNINPKIKILTYTRGITHENAGDFVQQVELIADCLDAKVDINLRGKLYDCARKKGIYAITFPILGFGGLCATSSPDGMSMDIFLTLLSRAMKAKIPAKLKETFVPEHVRIVEDGIKKGFIPSLGIATNVIPSVASTESLLILIKTGLPGARKPVILPKIIMVDFFNMKYTIEDIRKILE
ncbi:MAG: ThiF family adenylyltransferase [Candidatus Aminicenantes bacterium]|nr:MAG: ThiF family adenylyltransferase [Candidatus Aminicenantes bacterium]